MAFHIRAGGTWQPAKVVRIRVGGTWTLAKTVHQKIAGVWTQIWSALEITCSIFIGVSGANAIRTIGTIGGTAPFTVTSLTFFPTSGSALAWSASGLTVTLFYPGPGEDSEGEVSIIVTDANGATAKVSVSYSLTQPL